MEPTALGVAPLRNQSATHCVVLCGGISGERDVSLASGRAVAEALSRCYIVSTLDPALGSEGLQSWPHPPSRRSLPNAELGFPKLCEALTALVRQPNFSPKTGIVFNALHGTWGEDGRAQALLEVLGIPYTGSGSAASALAMDKYRVKQIVEAHGIRMAPSLCLHHKDQPRTESAGNEVWQKLRQLPPLEDSNARWIVKPNDQGSALATTICLDGDVGALLKALQAVFETSSNALIERYIPGRELTVGVLDQNALPPIEICAAGEFYDYEAKYLSGQTRYLCPAPVSETCRQQLAHWAIQAHNALGARHLSRIDFRLSPQGDLHFLELNTLPGMTATSLMPKAAQSQGLSLSDLCSTIVEIARA